MVYNKYFILLVLFYSIGGILISFLSHNLEGQIVNIDKENKGENNRQVKSQEKEVQKEDKKEEKKEDKKEEIKEDKKEEIKKR